MTGLMQVPAVLFSTAQVLKRETTSASVIASSPSKGVSSQKDRMAFSIPAMHRSRSPTVTRDLSGM